MGVASAHVQVVPRQEPDGELLRQPVRHRPGDRADIPQHCGRILINISCYDDVSSDRLDLHRGAGGARPPALGSGRDGSTSSAAADATG